MGLLTCRWCGRTFDEHSSTGWLVDRSHPICSDRCRREQQANSRQQWNEGVSAIGSVVDAFVQYAAVSRQQQEAAEFEAMAAEENRRLLERQQAEQERQQRLIRRDADLKQLLATLASSLDRVDCDEVGQLCAIEEFRNAIETNDFRVNDLLHVSDMQSFNNITGRAADVFDRISQRTHERFVQFKALYARYKTEFYGKTQFPKPISDDFTEKPKVTCFEVPQPMIGKLQVKDPRDLVLPPRELISLRQKRTALYWAIGISMASNLCLPVVGAVIAVGIYFIGLKPVNDALQLSELEYQQEVDQAHQTQLAELDKTHRLSLADWQTAKTKFEADIPELNLAIEEHNKSVRKRCAEAQATWEQRRAKAASTINGYIVRHPMIEGRFPKVGEAQQERDESLRNVFGVKVQTR
ncbi:MAG: hypothetical protein H6822_22370 [Planctomycetaceae bacterium]|nr:hypothetical protein [Planctomycetaceae bacterium]